MNILTTIICFLKIAFFINTMIIFIFYIRKIREIFINVTAKIFTTEKYITRVIDGVIDGAILIFSIVSL